MQDDMPPQFSASAIMAHAISIFSYSDRYEEGVFLLGAILPVMGFRYFSIG